MRVCDCSQRRLCPACGPPARQAQAVRLPAPPRPLRQSVPSTFTALILSSFLLLTTFGYIVQLPPKTTPQKRAVRFVSHDQATTPKTKKHRNHG